MQLVRATNGKALLKPINHGTIISEATLEITPEIVVTAIVSKALFKHGGLKVSVAKVYALIKSTGVTLVIDEITVHVFD